MTSKEDIRNLVESKFGNWTEKEAAIDSLWYSIRTQRPRADAIRGLANATSPGPNLPTRQELIEAEDLYDSVENKK